MKLHSFTRQAAHSTFRQNPKASSGGKAPLAIFHWGYFPLVPNALTFYTS